MGKAAGELGAGPGTVLSGAEAGPRQARTMGPPQPPDFPFLMTINVCLPCSGEAPGELVGTRVSLNSTASGMGGLGSISPASPWRELHDLGPVFRPPWAASPCKTPGWSKPALTGVFSAALTGEAL